MNTFVKAVVLLAAAFGAAQLVRRLRRLADPDASVYGHPGRSSS